MKRNKRHGEIMEMLAREGEVSVQALARHFGVSVMTIRRDLSHLSRSGRISRTHGGALPSRAGVIEFAYHEKRDRNAAAKQAIARRIADMVEPGTAVSLDTGTTTLEVARALAGMEGITVLTSSLSIAAVLYPSEGIELVLLGGTVRKHSPDLTGELTEDNLTRFRVHLAVLGADAVKPDGIFTTDISIARVSRAMIVSADHVVLAVDSSKFTQTAFVKCTDLDRVDCVVTDEGCTDDVRSWLEKAARDVTYVPAEPHADTR